MGAHHATAVAHGTPRRFDAVLVVAAGALVCWRALGVFFSADDFVYLAYSHHLTWPGPSGAVAERWLSGPVAFAASRWLFGLEARGFHVPVLALHITNALLLWRLVRRLEPGQPRLALAAGVLFAGHAAAYTVVAWLSAGFNEVPVVTATLVATHLALTAFERGRLAAAAASAVVILVGCGFKQHAMLAPAYLGAFGAYVAWRTPTAGPAPGRVVSLAAALLLACTVSAWVGLVAIPRMPAELSRAPYTRVLAAGSIADGYLRFLPHALNPFAVAREPLGMQEAMPHGMAPVSTAHPRRFRVAAILFWVAAIVAGARRLRLGRLAAASACVLFAALAVGVSLPDHQYDYYAYFGLPAAALLASVPIAALVDWIGGFRRVPRVLVAVSAVVLAAGAWLQGGVLHASNAVVRRARHVELLAAVAERSPDRSTLYFVPPTGLAREDTLQGAAIAMLYPAKGLRIEFAGSPGRQDRFFAGPDLWLVATRSLAHGSWRADLLDQAQWRNPDSTLILSQSEELRQPFVPRGEVLTALQVAARWYGRGCEVAYTILRAPEGSTAGSPPALVSGGLIACRSSIAGDSADIALGSIPLVPGARYLLSLVVLSGALHLPVVRADDTGFEPLSRRIGDRWDVSPHTLGLRLVRDALER